MSTHSTPTVIKRFTYDWLIRFAELHPFEDVDRLCEDNYIPTTFKYKPRYIYSHSHLLYDDNRKLPRHKTTVFVSRPMQFASLTSEEVTSFKKNNVFFHSQSMMIYNANIKSTDLKYMLKLCKYVKIDVRVALTEPIMFSELWPLVTHCEFVNFDIKNLIYGESIANVIRESQSCPNELNLKRLDVSEKAVLDLFDFILSLPTFPDFVQFHFLQKQSVSLAKAVVDKYANFGITCEYRYMPKTPYEVIRYNKCDGKLIGVFSDYAE